MLYQRDWAKARKDVKPYRCREPERTPLYRLVYTLRDELEYQWEERYQATYGVLRSAVLAALDEYLNCGLLCHGAARAYCDSCKSSILIAFSCKKRGICPSCSTKRAVIFAEHLQNRVLLKVPHRHVVFSIPKRLRAFFRYNRALGDLLFRAAWESIKQSFGSSPAAVLTLQTAGEALNFNPHLHGAVADGIFDTIGNFTTLGNINLQTIQEDFQDSVLSELHKLDLIDDGTVQQILRGTHTGFSVWFGEPFTDPDSNRFVARYIERGPLALDKLTIQDLDNTVTYTTKDGTPHRFPALDFLALLTSHIPAKWESLTRYYGYYSSRSRGERAGLHKPTQTISDLPETTKKASSSWAACMKRTFELNPLECPKCSAEMRIIAFLIDPSEISKVLRNLGINKPIMPEPIPRAPPSFEY